jgi:hypothetical protein
MIHPSSFVIFTLSILHGVWIFFFFTVGHFLGAWEGILFLAQHTRCYSGLHPLGTLILLLFDH